MADTVNINLDVDTKKAQANVAAFQGKIVNASDSAKSLKMSLTGAFAAVTGGNIAARIIGSLAQSFRESFTEAIKFETAIKEINTLLPRTAQLTDSLVQELTDLSVQYGTTQTQQAKSYYQVVSAGITDTSQALKVLTAANTLAVGGVGDVETAILGITKVLNNYGGAAGSAADISDVLFTAVKNGQTRIDEFAGELPKVLSISEQLGVSFEDTAAALTTLTNRSENTSVAATELRALLASLVKNQDDLSKVTDANGKSFSIAQLRVKGLVKFLNDLKVATGSTEGLQAALGGRIQSLNAVLKLSSGGFKSLSNNIKEFNNASGAAETAAARIQDSFEKKVERATSAVSRTFTGMLKIVTPGLGKLADGVANLLTPNQNENALADELKKITTAYDEAKKKADSFASSRTQGEADPFVVQLRAETLALEVQKNAIEALVASEKKLKAEKAKPTVTGSTDEQIKENQEKQKREQEFLEAKAALTEKYEDQSAEKRVERLEKIRTQEIENREADIIAKAEELERSGKHEEALFLLKDLRLKREARLQKQSLVLEQRTSKARVDIASASANLIAAVSADGSKAAFVAQKAAAIAQAVVATNLAATQALATPPAPNLPLATLAKVAGGINIAAIAATGIKGFADGGIIPDGDDRVIGVRKREMVLTEQDQQSLLDMIRGEGGGSGGSATDVNINLNAGIFTDALEIEVVKRDRENRTPLAVR